MKKIIINSIYLLGRISAFILPSSVIIKMENSFHIFYSARKSRSLKGSKDKILIKYPAYSLGEKYISIGDNFRSSYRFRIEAWDKYNNHTFSPSIIIGDNVSFSDNCHIGAIGTIKIGNNVLVGSNVYITDHYHGDTTSEYMSFPPIKRDLITKGEVVINDNVWIGDGVVILPNVTLGRSCIIGANSVVTKSFPDNCIIAGVPARIIKVNNH
jgi:acetyltransferase-like isoleucine patch superfamily enzyme